MGFTKHNMTINTANKPKGWVEALLKRFIKRNSMLVEFDTPKREYYESDERWMWRLRSVNPERLAAELKDPVYNRNENTITLQCEYIGTFGRFALDNGLVLSARVVKLYDGTVRELLAFDFIPKERHADYQ